MFSIIIPVYNSEKSLHRCIDSILKNKNVFFEIILIDDGSEDNSHNICRMYSEKYDNIKFYSQENMGVSAARNKGITFSTQKYILFIDSDDYIAENMLEILYKKMDNKESEIVFFGYNVVKNKEIISNNLPDIVESNEMNLSEYVYYLVNNDIFGYQCTKLYNSKIIKENKLCLKENFSLCEDLIFTCEYIKKCSKIDIINLPLYNYVQSTSDTLSKKRRSNLFEIQSYICEYMYEFYKDINMDERYLSELIFKRCCLGIIETIRNTKLSINGISTYYKILSGFMYNIFKRYYKRYKKMIRGNRRFIFILLYYYPKKVY